MSTEPSAVDVLFVVLDIDFTLENSPVLQTQVGEQMLALQGLGYRTGLATTSCNGDAFDRVIGFRLRRCGVWVGLVAHGTFAGNLLRLVRLLRRERHRLHGATAYARGIWGWLAFTLAGVPRRGNYVYDVRGALGDESRTMGTARWRVSIFRRLERRALRGAAAVSAVSRPLAEMLQAAYGVNRVQVIPSCVRTAPMVAAAARRLDVRQAYGFAESDVVLTYCGGLDAYQKVPEMIELWCRLAGDPHVRFLLVTNDAPSTGATLTGLDRLEGQLTRVSVPRSDVPGVLAAGDIGFLLRDSRDMNRAASPVKFAEYIAAGLAVVGSPSIGDISHAIEELSIGVLVDPSDPDQSTIAVRRFVAEFRDRRIAIREQATSLAKERYDWDAHAAAYRLLYGAAGA